MGVVDQPVAALPAMNTDKSDSLVSVGTGRD
jgi:hypothetical protein